MNHIPEVTVLMAVYNGLPFLAEAVASILRQTFKNFTFVIVDDGSTDGSGDYLDQLGDLRVRVVHHSNRGQGAARNVGLAMCNTEFTAFADADDVVCRIDLKRN